MYLESFQKKKIKKVAINFILDTENIVLQVNLKKNDRKK